MTNGQLKHNKSVALIMAGGTGGHIFPGLAVARGLQKNNWTVHWLGSVAGMETKIIGDTNIPLHLISISGLRGKGLLGWIKAPLTIFKAVFQALKVIHKIKPNVVIGFGGFASGPGGMAAFMLNKYLLIHEQNAVAGLTNRMLSKLSKKNFQAFPNALGNDDFSVTIGNPIRKDILALNKTTKHVSSKIVKVLIIGGSRGAQILNQQLPIILAPMIKENKVSIKHQSGSKNKSKTLDAYQKNQVVETNLLEVTEFINDMSAAYSWADVVICRSGALTVSEISAIGIAAILIPFPHAVDDHQTKNALWLVNNNAGVLIDESNLLNEESKNKIVEVISNKNQLEVMAINSKKIAYLNATNLLVSACEQLVGKAA